MGDFVRVKDKDNMVRDKKSGAILYINNNENARDVKKRRKLEEQQLKDDVNNLKNEIGEIKQLLMQLIEKR